MQSKFSVAVFGEGNHQQVAKVIQSVQRAGATVVASDGDRQVATVAKAGGRCQVVKLAAGRRETLVKRLKARAHQMVKLVAEAPRGGVVVFGDKPGARLAVRQAVNSGARVVAFGGSEPSQVGNYCVEWRAIESGPFAGGKECVLQPTIVAKRWLVTAEGERAQVIGPEPVSRTTMPAKREPGRQQWSIRPKWFNWNETYSEPELVEVDADGEFASEEQKSNVEYWPLKLRNRRVFPKRTSAHHFVQWELDDRRALDEAYLAEADWEWEEDEVRGEARAEDEPAQWRPSMSGRWWDEAAAAMEAEVMSHRA